MAYGKAGDWYINNVEGGGGESDLTFANVILNITGDAEVGSLSASEFVTLNPNTNKLGNGALLAGDNKVVLYQGFTNSNVHEEDGDYVITSLTGDGNIAIEQKQDPLFQKNYWDVTITGDCTLNANVNWA